jgi:hypothetical protein
MKLFYLNRGRNVTEERRICRLLKHNRIPGSDTVSWMMAEKTWRVYCVNLLNIGTYGTVNSLCVTDSNSRQKQVRNLWLGLSQRANSRRGKSAATRSLGSRFESRRVYRCLSLMNVVYSAVRGPWDRLIPRPGQSYRVRLCHWVWPGTIIRVYTYSW